MAGAYKNITTSTTTLVQSGRVELKKVVVNAPGTTWSIAIYDSLLGSGALVGTILPSTTGGGNYDYDAALSNGLTIVTTGTAGDITVVYG